MIDRERSALLIADVQIDFLPGGALGVPRGDEVVAPNGALLRSGLFVHVVATQDWHAPNHISFASRHPGRRPFEKIPLYGREQELWPDHCVAGSPGAALHPDVPWEAARAILRKGTDPEVDSYSAFRSNWNAQGRRPPTGLGGFLRECGVTHVYVCGLARDFCVKWSAEDAADLGFDTVVIWDLARPVDPGSDDAVRAALREKRVTIVESRELR